MRSPIDVIEGHIVDYDPESQELIIKAKYPSWATMIRRKYRDCRIQLMDGRPLSDKQRRSVYALLHEISDYTGQGLSTTKDEMKRRFMEEELCDASGETFSLADSSMSLICAFQRYLIRFMLDYDIPCKRPLLDYVDDINDYIYSCVVYKKCCICGKRADLHHTSPVGAGRDRSEIIHEGMLVLPLCREHHTEAHSIGRKSFKAKYHLSDGIVLDKFLCGLYGLNTKEDTNGTQ